jgi:uncharacterized membrane protein (DUF485 family)
MTDGNAMASRATNVDATVDLPAMSGALSIAALIEAKIRLFTPMIVIYVAGYIGLTALAAFAKGFMALKVIGALNVGFFLIACNYVLSLIIALAYVRVANGILDPMVRRLVSTPFGKGAPR